MNDQAESPAQGIALGAREALERVLLIVRDFPKHIKRKPLKASLHAALQSLGRLAESDLDDEGHLSKLEEASRAMVDLQQALQLDRAASTKKAPSKVERRSRRAVGTVAQLLTDCRKDTVDALVLRQRTRDRSSAMTSAAVMPRPFRASIGVPQLHQIPSRRPLPPRIELVRPTGMREAMDADRDTLRRELVPSPVTPSEEADGKMATQPASDSENDEAVELPVGLAETEDDDTPLGFETTRRVVRDCLQDVATLSALRKPHEAEGWADVGRFEQRLLDNLDAFVSLGHPWGGGGQAPDPTSEVLRYAGEASFIDRGRCFTRAFVLGCIEGEDTVRAAILALEQSDPETFAAQGEGLALAPHPSIGPAAERLLASSHPKLLVTALNVLRKRRQARFASAGLLVAHPDPDVAVAAATALRVVPEHPAAAEALGDLLRLDDDDDVVLTAAETLTLIDSPLGLSFARDRLPRESLEADVRTEEFIDRAMWLLALCGGSADRTLVEQARQNEPKGAEAIGWFGDPRSVPVLIEWLQISATIWGGRSAHSPLEVRVVEALHRITGADLTTVGGSPPNRELSTHLTVDHTRWSKWWDDNHKSFVDGRRYRNGKPYTPSASLDELERPTGRAEDRKRAWLELSAALRASLPVEVDDWVARQRRVFAAIREQLSSFHYTPGDFAGDRIGRAG